MNIEWRRGGREGVKNIPLFFKLVDERRSAERPGASFG